MLFGRIRCWRRLKKFRVPRAVRHNTWTKKAQSSSKKESDIEARFQIPSAKLFLSGPNMQHHVSKDSTDKYPPPLPLLRSLIPLLIQNNE